MTARRRSIYLRLLRWYPASWRRANASLMLDTLEEHADASERAHPTTGEAWSLRAHGLAERATLPAIIALSSVALLLSLSAVAVMWSGGITTDPWAQSAWFSAQYLGDLLVCLAASALLLRRGFLSAERALFSATVAIPAWVFGGLTAASWSIGFDEADAGMGRSWFGSATLLFFGVAVLLGTIALAPLFHATFRTVSSSFWRWTLTVAIAVLSAVMVGVAASVQSMTALAAASILLTAGLHLRKPHERVALPPRPREPLAPTYRRQLALVTAIAAVLGLGCVALALTGSTWTTGSPDATQAMRLGILLGALVATLVVAASAIMLFSRLGRTIAWSGTALIAALVMVALSYTTSIDNPTSWVLTLLAGALTGLATGILFLPVLPHRVWLRVLILATISLALAGNLGLMFILAAAFLAPVVALILTVILLRGPRAAVAIDVRAHTA